MNTFVGLLDKDRRAEFIEDLTRQFEAEKLLIFVRDPEIGKFLPAPGFDQTIQHGKMWQELLHSHANKSVFSDSISFNDDTKKRVTLLSYDGKISLAVVGVEVPNAFIEEALDGLPFLATIFQKEKAEQYSRVQLSEAEHSVIENKMIALKLDETRRQLQKALIKTREEIEMIKKAREFKKSVDLLTKQRDDLLHINQVKDQFISVASHQLRTPATAAKQYMGLLLENYAGELNEKQVQYLQIAYQSNEAQLSILNDLLKTAQLDSADVTFKKRQTPLKPVIEKIIHQLAPTFSLKNQQIFFEYTDMDVSAPMNEDDIRLALTNLMENASKYTEAGKNITVKLSSDENYVTIGIQDEGVGIREKDILNIFEKFTRIDNELSDTVTGSGLGLYLVKRIVQLHGGEIKVTSTIGQGSLFTVRLPL